VSTTRVNAVVAVLAATVAAQEQHPYATDRPIREPMRFGDGMINTEADVYGPTFTPDGRTIYYTLRKDRDGHESIVFSRFEDGRWTPPETASFSTHAYDKEPYLSPDGRRMFFASTRPQMEGDERTAFDIWVVDRAGDGWGEPRRLGPAVNGPGYDNYPAVAANGNLYFGSEREAGRGRLDIYVSRFVNGEYQPAENLGAGINTAATDTDPYIAPDESFIIFTSTRDGTRGEGDLYVSRRENGAWTAPRHLGDVVNGASFDYTPFVSPDGRYLFYSRGWGEILQVDLAAVGMDARRSAP